MNAYQMEGKWCCKRRPHWDRMPGTPTLICRPKDHHKWAGLNTVQQHDLHIQIHQMELHTTQPVWTILQNGQPLLPHNRIFWNCETHQYHRWTTCMIINLWKVIWFPLFLVVCISSMKDYFEDHKRHVSDEAENKRRTNVLTENGFTECEWQNVRVGDIVKVECDEYFPADMTILGGIMSKGRCFIETKNLDGETNLKVK